MRNDKPAPARIAVLGCGSIGRRHAANLQGLGGAELLVHDADGARAEAWAQPRGLPVAGSLEAVWAWRPAAVVIATPTQSHVALAREAARRGCHLFIEKPVGAALDEALRELLQEIAQRRLIALVGCNLRFHPGLQIVRRVLAEGRLGTVTALRGMVGQYLPDWHPGEDYRLGYSARRALGGGIILDAIHEIDYARWLLGEVRRVMCLAGRLSRLEIDTEDTAALLLEFERGAIGELHLDYVHRGYARSCDVIGDEGTVRWDYAAGTVQLYTAAGGRWEVLAAAPDWDPNRMYVDEMSHFLRCLAGLEAPQLDAAGAAQVLAIALAAKASAGSGQAVAVPALAPEAALAATP